MVKKLKWTPDLVKKFWNGVAQTPLDNLSFGRLAGPALLDIVAPHLRKEGRHLDYGAGSGHLTQVLLERGYATAAYEPSPERARELRERIGHLPGFLGIVDESSSDEFDVVLLAEVVEHLLDEDFEQALSRVNRFLAPGGTLIVTTPNNENLENASVYCPVSEVLYHPWQHVRSFTPESVSDLMARFGFERAFLGTVDFSADCQVHEAFKRSQKVESAMVDIFEKLLREQREFYSQLLATEKQAMQNALTEQLRAMAAVLEEQRQKFQEGLPELAARHEASATESQRAAVRLMERDQVLLALQRETFMRLAELERTTLIGRLRWMLFRQRRESHYNALMDQIASLESSLGRDIRSSKPS